MKRRSDVITQLTINGNDWGVMWVWMQSEWNVKHGQTYTDFMSTTAEHWKHNQTCNTWETTEDRCGDTYSITSQPSNYLLYYFVQNI